MNTAIGTFQLHQKGAITPALGEVKPRDIFWLGRRVIDEMTVTNLGNALARDDSFFHPIPVRDEGSGRYRLIAGLHRVEASKRRCGEDRPIPAIIYPPHTPDALIELLEIEENLFRKELTAAERTAQEMRWAAAFKKLSGGNLVTPVTETGEAAESGKLIPILPRARRGRGNKGMAQQIAEKAGISKRAVNMRRTSAAAVIGEEIDFDGDTPEELERKAAELERKADKRQHVEPKVEPRKRIRLVIKRPTSPAKPEAAEAGSKFEEVWKAFNALGRKHRLRFIHDACLHVGLDPLKMASLEAFGLADEELELAVDLPTEVAPATDAVAEQVEHGDEVALAGAEQGDDGADVGAEDLQVADDASGDADDGAAEDADDNLSEAVDPEDFGAEDLQVADDVDEAADQEPGGAMKCAYCNIEFEDGDQLEEFNGKLYHGFCVEDAKRLAKAKQAKQIAIAA